MYMESLSEEEIHLILSRQTNNWNMSASRIRQVSALMELTLWCHEGNNIKMISQKDCVFVLTCL